LAQDEEDGPVEPAPLPTVREARYSRSLERGLAILGCFTPAHPLLGIAELAEKVGMSRPTTHRYVSTLVSLGYLEQDVTRKYRLGLGTIDLGAGLNAMGLCKHAHPHLQELAQRSGYAAEIAVLDGTEILLLDRLHNSRAGHEKPAEVAQACSRPTARAWARCCSRTCPRDCKRG
jgi:IclR family pca regulon transcriptional regulator